LRLEGARLKSFHPLPNLLPKTGAEKSGALEISAVVRRASVRKIASDMEKNLSRGERM
jgi:hypothetical protein